MYLPIVELKYRLNSASTEHNRRTVIYRTVNNRRGCDKKAMLSRITESENTVSIIMANIRTADRMIGIYAQRVRKSIDLHCLIVALLHNNATLENNMLPKKKSKNTPSSSACARTTQPSRMINIPRIAKTKRRMMADSFQKRYA